MTQAPSLIQLFVAPLNRADLPYAVTGGLAAVAYGHPRLTLDVDLLLGLHAADVPRFVALWDAGTFYVPPAEALVAEASRAAHGHANLLHGATGMRADLYLAGTNEFHAWALRHPVVREVEGERVRFAPPEYVIAYKLLYVKQGGSDRHLRDVARIESVSEADIDRPTLDRWIRWLGVAEQHERARALAEGEE